MPTVTIVTVEPFVPLVVQTAAVWLAKVTGLPDAPPVADTVKAASPKTLLPNAAKVMVWGAMVIEILCVTCGAAKKALFPP